MEKKQRKTECYPRSSTWIIAGEGITNPIRRFFLYIFCAVFALYSLAARANPDPSMPRLVRLVTYIMRPYQFFAENRIGGTAIQRVRCALEGISVPYEIIFINSTAAKSARNMVMNRQVDGFFSAEEDVEANVSTIPSLPVVVQKITWFSRKYSEIDFDDKEDIVQGKFGAKFGSKEWRYLFKNGYHVVKRPRSPEVLLQMLLIGEIDVALIDKNIFLYQMNQSNLSESAFRQIFLMDNNLAVQFKKSFIDSHPSFLEKFNTSLFNCKNTEKQ